MIVEYYRDDKRKRIARRKAIAPRDSERASVGGKASGVGETCLVVLDAAEDALRLKGRI